MKEERKKRERGVALKEFRSFAPSRNMRNKNNNNHKHTTLELSAKQAHIDVCAKPLVAMMIAMRKSQP
jgi:hypothetical protein